MQEQQKTKKNKLKVDSQIFMENTSAYNPFGPNYVTLPYDAKVAYKYNMMKGYIKLTPQDQVIRNNEQQRYLGTLILGYVGGVALAGGLRMVLRRFKSFEEIADSFNFAFKGISIAACITQSYFIATQRYNKVVSSKFLYKYLDQARENGFEDYQISL